MPLNPKVMILISLLLVFIQGLPAEDISHDIVERTRRSLYKLESYYWTEKIGEGVGFGYADDRSIVTAYHVVANATEIKVINLETKAEYTVAKVKKVNVVMDSCMLTLDRPAAHWLPLSDKGAKQGQDVIIAGNPVGLSNTLSRGMVSSTDLDRGGFIQLDANVSPGNSGGPVMDAKGDVVGILTAKVVGLTSEGIAFASPISYINNGIDYDLSVPCACIILRPGAWQEVTTGSPKTIVTSTTFYGKTDKGYGPTKHTFDRSGLMLTFNSDAKAVARTYGPDGVLYTEHDKTFLPPSH